MKKENTIKEMMNKLKEIIKRIIVLPDNQETSNNYINTSKEKRNKYIIVSGIKFSDKEKAEEMQGYINSRERWVDYVGIAEKAFKENRIEFSFEEFIKAFDNGSLYDLEKEEVIRKLSEEEYKKSKHKLCLPLKLDEELYNRITDIEKGEEFFNSFIDFLKKTDPELKLTIDDYYKEKESRQLDKNITETQNSEQGGRD